MYSINFYLIALVSAFVDSDIRTVQIHYLKNRSIQIHYCKIEVLKEMNVCVNESIGYIIINTDYEFNLGENLH